MPDICVGRDDEDQEEHGLEGTGMIGKHLVGEGHEAHTANPVYLDLARPHVLGIFGKRGTGKCLMPDQKVLTSEGLIEIKKLFERALEEGEAEIDNKDEQLFEFEGPEVVSANGFNTDSNSIVAGYRKRVDERVYRIKTRSGRRITVTSEHPLLKVDGWENSDELEEGDKIGIPRKVENFESKNDLKIPSSFQKTEYSSRNFRESEMLKSERKKISELSDGSGSYQRMVKKAEQKGLINVSNGEVSVTESGNLELENRLEGQYYRVGKCRPIQVPEKVDERFARFTSYLLAEGHERSTKNNTYRLIFTNNNEKLLDDFTTLFNDLFGVEMKKMDDMSVYSDVSMLRMFLEENGYETCKDSFSKSIPDYIFRAEDRIVSTFLQIYFDCEANVTDQQIDLMTASEDMANDILYLLKRFGIIGRCSVKEKYASNTEEEKVREYHQITVSGASQLQKFKDEIGFQISYKSQKLSEIIKGGNTNVDTVPCGLKIKKCREKLGANRTQIAKHKQSLKAYEDGKNDPSREKLAEIVQSIEKYSKEIDKQIERLKENPRIEDVKNFIEYSGIKWKEVNQELGYSRTDRRFLKYNKYQKNPEKLAKVVIELYLDNFDLDEGLKDLEELKTLSKSNIFWDEIEQIEKVNYKGWVYDLTVEENHSFTAGFGGLICHNSYSMGTIAEEIQDADISQNLSTIIIDSMGVYWSMKKPNERAAGILEKWDIKPKNYDANIYIPEGKTEQFSRKEIPYDETFTINAGELSSDEWIMALELEKNSDEAILLERSISKLKEEAGEDYRLRHIEKAIKKFDFDTATVRSLENRLENAEEWGIFGEESSLDRFTQREEMSIIDMSVFGEMSAGWSVRSLVVGLLSKRILRQRMQARRIEEVDEMEGISKNEMPIAWMLIDEAHQFLPANGKTPATKPLLRWVKVGREPGVSLVLATQQPAKLHPNALSQCDLILSHRLTAKQDIEALGEIMQSYMRNDIHHYIDALPDSVGTGIVLDDNSERIFPIKMRPRRSWHAGGTPDAYEE